MGLPNLACPPLLPFGSTPPGQHQPLAGSINRNWERSGPSPAGLLVDRLESSPVVHHPRRGHELPHLLPAPRLPAGWRRGRSAARRGEQSGGLPSTLSAAAWEARAGKQGACGSSHLHVRPASAAKQTWLGKLPTETAHTHLKWSSFTPRCTVSMGRSSSAAVTRAPAAAPRAAPAAGPAPPPPAASGREGEAAAFCRTSNPAGPPAAPAAPRALSSRRSCRAAAGEAGTGLPRSASGACSARE